MAQARESATASANNADRFIGVREVAALISYSPHSMARKAKEPDFPKARRVGANRIAWLESEIHDYMRSRPTA